MTKEEAEAQYNEYLEGHIGNVQEALELLKTLDIEFVNNNYDVLKAICEKHDELKYSPEEYEPYREHFYPINDEEKLKSEAFEQATRHHVKNSKHHWDYWVDDKNELNIPDKYDYLLYTVERCCDWLAMANQHDEVANSWYNANKDAIIMPDYAWELCDEIMSKVPEKCDFSFKGVRGNLDESTLNESELDLRNKIIRLKGKAYLDGIDKKSNGHAGYYALSKIVNNLEKEHSEKVSKQSDIGISDEEYIQAMKDMEIEKNHPKYYTKNDGTNMIRNDAGGYEEIDESNLQERIKTAKQLYNEASNKDKKKIEKKLKENGYTISDIDNNYNDEIEIIICNILRKDRVEYFDKIVECFKNIEKTNNGYLVEANIRQLKRKTLSEDPTRAKKSKHVQSKYIGISKYGVLNFQTTSETHSGVNWYQELHFLSFNGFMNIVEQGDSIDKNDVKMAIMGGDVKISCFTEDSEVITSDGVKRIKDIKVGDKVLTHTGRYQEVIQTYENDYDGELIEINGVKSTPNHPYLVKLPNGDIKWMMACEITQDMMLLEISDSNNDNT